MKAPNFNVSVWFSLLIGIEGLIFAVLTYYKINFSWLICWLLVGILFCLVGFFLDFYIRYLAFYKTVKDISDKHHALSKEYDKKNEILDEYEMTFANLSHMVFFAMTTLSEREKDVYRNIFDFLSIHKQKISGVKRNE